MQNSPLQQRLSVESFLMPLEKSSARRRGINSVEIGLRVLAGVVQLAEPASLKAIAEKAGMESSQTHRYVSSLVKHGMLRQIRESGLYDLGPAALRLGLAAMARQDSLAGMEAARHEFSRANGVTTLLTVWGTYGPTILRWYQGSPPVYTALTVGSVMPVTRSATGRVFMALLAEQLIEPFLEREGWKKPMSRNPELVALCRQIRSTRISSVDGSFIPGLRAHAAPILGIGDTLLGVLSICTAESFPQTRDATLRAKLLAAARQLSLDLGASSMVARK